MSEPFYYLWINGERTGPFLLNELRESVNSGQLPGVTLCSQDGETEWKPVMEVVLANPIATPPPPMVPAPEDNPAAPPGVRIYEQPAPIAIIYFLGVVGIIVGVIVLGASSDGRQESIGLVGICSGISALLMGYLYDLIAQILFELKEANRLRNHTSVV